MNDKVKRFIFMLSYSVFIVYILFQGERYSRILKQNAASSFDMTNVVMYSVFFPITLGLLIALPYVVSEFRKQGKWRVDWIKLLAVGGPSLYLIAFYLLYFSNLPLFEYLYPSTMVFLMTNTSNVMTLGGVVFGYVVPTSLYKENLNDN